ncbi:unnamed protein product [Allacma fusca]|uniref:Uncharacterized protein n=1 Tax=Allacma fusca TaxID=39272 RepID=A0A8J2LCJ6_9HEXA|nr:unnamed protein product [Allacma fusca]
MSIVLVADLGYAFNDFHKTIGDYNSKLNLTSDLTTANASRVYGVHGYDNETAQMQAFFRAHGPLFKSRIRIAVTKMLREKETVIVIVAGIVTGRGSRDNVDPSGLLKAVLISFQGRMQIRVKEPKRVPLQGSSSEFQTSELAPEPCST